MYYIVIPIFSDPILHPLHVDNFLSLLYVKEIGENSKMLTFNHTDLLSEDSFDFLKDKIILTPNKKELLTLYPFKEIYDINLLNFWINNKPLALDDIKCDVIDIFHNRYYNLKNINVLIPIYKHLEYCDKVSKLLEDVWGKKDSIEFDRYDIYNNDSILALYSIERNGIEMSDDVLDIFDARVEKHISNNKLYSDYFLYTSTGRPSNAFGSINFAALTKDQQKAIIPENDYLIEYDYDAYHLRLIADFIGYTFPEGSVHEYLASFYGVNYKESKAISFRLLYGGINNDIAKSIPFFGKVQQFIYQLWDTFNKQKYIKTHIYNRRLSLDNYTDMNMNKLFNYLLQAHETECNIKTIIELQKYLFGKKSKLILYRYDSFLFDISKQDGDNMLQKVKQILERNGHPVKSSGGII